MFVCNVPWTKGQGQWLIVPPAASQPLVHPLQTVTFKWDDISNISQGRATTFKNRCDRQDPFMNAETFQVGSYGHCAITAQLQLRARGTSMQPKTRLLRRCSTQCKTHLHGSVVMLRVEIILFMFRRFSYRSNNVGQCQSVCTGARIWNI